LYNRQEIKKKIQDEAAVIKRLGISIICWNHGAFGGHCLDMPHGMME